MAVESVTARPGFVDDMQGLTRGFELTNYFVDGFLVSEDGSIAADLRGVLGRQGDIDGIFMNVQTYKHAGMRHSSPPLCGSIRWCNSFSITHALKDGELLFYPGSCSHYV